MGTDILRLHPPSLLPSLRPSARASFPAIAQLAVAWKKQPGSGRTFDFEYMVNPVSNEPVTLEHLLAAELLQQAVRGHLGRRCGKAGESFYDSTLERKNKDGSDFFPPVESGVQAVLPCTRRSERVAFWLSFR